jgi:hypothetical protein
VSKSSLASRWRKGLSNLRDDERGAETGEYVMWTGLTVFAIAVIAGLLIKAFRGKAEDINKCLGASTKTGFSDCNS